MLSHTRTKPRELPRRKTAGPICARVGDELSRLEANWPDTKLYPASPAPSFAWLSAARLAFCETAELRILTTERDGQTQAAAALAAVGHGPTWRWMPLGSELGEPTDLAGNDPQALQCLALALVRQGQPIVLDRMPADSIAIAAIRRAARGRAVVVRQEAEPELAIELDESWVRAERRLSLDQQKEYRRAYREAERLGSVSIEIHAPDLFELPGLLDAVFQCEGSHGPADETTIARRMSAAVFFRHYCEAACTAGMLRICLVRIAGRVAAAAIAIEQGETLWLLRSACHARYEICQAGQILVRELLSYCAEAGLRRCELWGEQHAWLRVWPVVARPCVRLSIYPLTIAGAIAGCVDAAAGCWRKLARMARAARLNPPARPAVRRQRGV